MKVVSYQAADGTLFASQAEQAKHDTFLKVHAAIVGNEAFDDFEEVAVELIALKAQALLEILKANVVPVYGPRGKKSAAVAE